MPISHPVPQAASQELKFSAVSSSKSQILVQPGLQFPFVPPCLPFIWLWYFILHSAWKALGRAPSFVVCLHTSHRLRRPESWLMLWFSWTTMHYAHTQNTQQEKNEDLLVFELHFVSPTSLCSHQQCADGVRPCVPRKRLSSFGKVNYISVGLSSPKIF